MTCRLADMADNGAMSLAAQIIDQQVSGIAERESDTFTSELRLRTDEHRRRSIAFLFLVAKTAFDLTDEQTTDGIVDGGERLRDRRPVLRTSCGRRAPYHPDTGKIQAGSRWRLDVSRERHRPNDRRHRNTVRPCAARAIEQATERAGRGDPFVCQGWRDPARDRSRCQQRSLLDGSSRTANRQCPEGVRRAGRVAPHRSRGGPCSPAGAQADRRRPEAHRRRHGRELRLPARVDGAHVRRRARTADRHVRQPTVREEHPPLPGAGRQPP